MRIDFCCGDRRRACLCSVVAAVAHNLFSDGMRLRPGRTAVCAGVVIEQGGDISRSLSF